METTSMRPKKPRLAPKIDKQMYHKNWEHNYERPSATVTSAVERLFNKRFEIVRDEEFRLPSPESMFVGSPWEIDELKELKEDLNKTKSQLNDFNLMKWQNHTRRRNQAGEVQWRLKADVNPEFLTQAWSKFYENVSSFPLIPEETLKAGKLNSVHLCEAPGAFITSLNHYLKLNSPGVSWEWTATTLNPHYEGNSISTMINDDRFILHTGDHWFFGADDTGDIMNLKNLDELGEEAKRKGEIMLVTADGSISCLDRPDEQESVVVQLHFCEVVAALHLLEQRGSLLLKIFTVFECQTVCLMFLLSCCFERVIMNKPATSKEGNSEVYVVCLGFRGEESIRSYLEVLRRHYEEGEEAPMFQRHHVPEGFVRQIIEAGEFFKAHQREVIENNIMKFNAMMADHEMRRIRRAVAEHFVESYNLRPLEEEMEIVGKQQLGMFACEVMGSKFSEDSFNDRKKKEVLVGYERLMMVKEVMDGVPGGEEAVVFQVRVCRVMHVQRNI